MQDLLGVWALNVSTGSKLWNYTTGSFVETSPSVADGIVCVGSDDGNIYSLNLFILYPI